MEAAYYGYKDKVEGMLEYGPSDLKINMQDKKGRTALMLAVLEWHEEIVLVLIKSKTRGDSADQKDKPAELIKDELNLDLQDKDGNSALMLAIMEGHQAIAVELIKSGANINLKNNNDQSALDIAREEYESAINSKNAKLSKSLGGILTALQKKEDELSKLLLKSVHNRDVRNTLKAIKEGADINAINEEGKSTLIIAVIAEHEEIIKILIDNYKDQIDFNLKDNNGHSALDAAILAGNKEIVKILIDAGADIESSKTALRFAQYKIGDGSAYFSTIEEYKEIEKLINNKIKDKKPGEVKDKELAEEDFKSKAKVAGKKEKSSTKIHIVKTPDLSLSPLESESLKSNNSRKKSR